MRSIMVPALNSSLHSARGATPPPAPILSLKWLMAGGILIFAFACLQSAPAFAHAMLVKAEPARRAQLTQAPSQVRLWFNEEVEKDYASLSVLDPAKSPVTDALPQISADDPKAIVLALPELEQVAGLDVGLVTAPEGRSHLARSLQRRGARVLRADVYDRVPVPPSPQALARLRAR